MNSECTMPRSDEFTEVKLAPRARCKVALASIAVIGCLLSACSTSSLLDSEAPVPTNYVIAPLPAATSRTESPASAVDIAVGRPDVAPGLDTPRIAVLRGRELDYFRGVQWSGTTLEIVQAMLVASLEDQKLFRSVTAEQTRVSGAYTLDTEVRDFQAEYAEGRTNPRVRVTIVGRLIRIADRALVDTISATAVHDVNDNRMGPVAAAFEAACQQVARQLAHEAAAAVSTDRRKLATTASSESAPSPNAQLSPSEL